MFLNNTRWNGRACRFQVLSAVLLLLTGAAKAVAAPTRMAIVASGTGTQVANLLTAAEVRLADDPDLQLLDRENVRLVLAEQKLTVSGWVDPAQAVRVGKLLDVQLFAVLRDLAVDNGNPDLVVFSVQTGARIWDTPLAGETLEKKTESLVAALQAARGKFPASPKGIKTVSLLTVRNADLPRSSDPLVQAAGRWLERELLRSRNLTVLERSQARRLSEERKLPTAAPLPDLWPSLRLIELEIGRGDGEKLRGTARVTGSEGTELFTVNVSVAGRDPLAIAEALARELVVKLEAEPGGEGPGRQEESLRFYRESQFFRHHDDYDRALVAAEAAHALAPDDNRILRWLAWVAGMAATEKIDPGRSNSGGRPKHLVSAEALAASLPLGRRGLETLAELYIRQTRSPNWPRLSEDIPHPFLRIYLGKIASLPDLSEKQQQEVDALLADYRAFLVDTVWPACRRAGDGPPAYRNATSTLSGWIVLDQFSTLSQRRSDWAADLAGMLRDWGAIAESRLANEDPLELRLADYLLGNLRHKHQHGPLNPGVYAALSGAYKDLSTKESPLLRLRGIWLKVSLDQLAAAQPDTRGLAPDPQETASRLAALLREAKALIVDSGTPPHLRNTWIELVCGSFEQLAPERRLEESQQFCEFLLEHKIYHERTIENCLLRLSHGEQREQQAAVALSEKAIGILEQPSGDLTDRQRAQAIHGLQERRAAVMAKLGPIPARSAPWESARTIVDLEKHPSEFRAIVRPAIDGKRVAALGLRLPEEYELDQAGRAEFALLQFPLDGGSQIRGGALVVSDLPIRELAERSTQSGSSFVPASLVVGDDYFAATSGKGIVRFSLTDDSVHAINGKQGLPSDYVQHLASDGRRLYAWLGKPRAESYLVSCLLHGSDLEVIASSRRAVKSSPLDDATPSICRWMTWDAPHKRVVLHLVETGGNHASIWQFTPKNGTLEQILKLGIAFSQRAPRQVDRDRLLMYDRTIFTTASQADNVAAVFDLRNDALHEVYVRDYKLSRLGNPITLVGGTIWQSAPWGGLNLQDEQFERFPPLREVEREFDFQPGAACLPIGDGKLLLGDNSGLWLLRLKEPSSCTDGRDLPCQRRGRPPPQPPENHQPHPRTRDPLGL